MAEVSMPDIPLDIIRHILLKLEVKSLIRFQCVCNQWRSLIRDSDFKLSYHGPKRVIVVMEGSTKKGLTFGSITDNLCLEKHFNKFREHLPFFRKEDQFYGDRNLRIGRNSMKKVNRLYAECWPPRVWHSCNGVVLFNVDEHLLLWNPSIRCCTKVLELKDLGDRDYSVDSGFCYDSSTRDYKVILLLCHQTPDYGGQFVIVASLKNKQWREVPFPYNKILTRSGINFHCTLHWMTSDIKRERRQTNYYDYNSNDSRDWEWDNFSGLNKIVYFDPECDEFKDLPTPEPRHGREESIVGLGIINDCLCMARKVEETGMIEVLIMQEYKIKESWVSKFAIPISEFQGDPYELVFYSLKCNSKVLIWTTPRFERSRIFVYNLKRNKPENLVKELVHGSLIGKCFYVESFVSPHEFIWRDDQHSKHNGSRWTDIKWLKPTD